MEKEIAKGLLEIGAVFLRPQQPFTWASGIKSPIYCDNRLILSYPDFRTEVEEGIAQLVRDHFPQAQILEGTATAGIAHAALAAQILGLPMGYVRGSNKNHGRKNRIEGKLEAGDKVVVIEDLISTGGSVLQTVDALREAGAEVIGIIAIFSYGMEKSRQQLDQAGLPLFTLTKLDTVVEVAAQEGYIQEEDKKKLLAFRDHPEDESWIQA